MKLLVEQQDESHLETILLCTRFVPIVSLWSNIIDLALLRYSEMFFQCFLQKHFINGRVLMSCFYGCLYALDEFSNEENWRKPAKFLVAFIERKVSCKWNFSMIHEVQKNGIVSYAFDLPGLGREMPSFCQNQTPLGYSEWSPVQGIQQPVGKILTTASSTSSFCDNYC